MAESVGTVYIDMMLDGRKFKAQLIEVERGAQKSGDLIAQNIAAPTSFALSLITRKLVSLAGMIVAAFSIHKIVQFAKESMLLSARIETLNVSLQQIGKNAGYTNVELTGYVNQVKKMGITTEESISSLIKLAQANIGLSQASKLARIAQDAAVIGNINSSEAFARMIHGIRTGQTEVLRNIGLQVSMEGAYAKIAAQLGKNVASLTQTERAQGIVNAVVKEGAKIQGIYEAAMNTAGKQMQSTKRYVDLIKESIGAAFGPALTILVMGFNKQLKELGEWLALPGTKEKITEIAISIKNMVSTVWNTLTKLTSVIGQVTAVLIRFWDEAKAVAIGMGGFFLTSFLLGIGGVVSLSTKITNLITKLRLLSLTLLTTPAGIIALALSGLAYAYFKVKDETEKAENAIKNFQLRLGTLSVAEAETELAKLEKKLVELQNKVKETGWIKTERITFSVEERKKYRTNLGLQQDIRDTKELIGLTKKQIENLKIIEDGERRTADAKKKENVEREKAEQLALARPMLEAQQRASALAIMKTQHTELIKDYERTTKSQAEIMKVAKDSELEIATYNYNRQLELNKKLEEQQKKETEKEVANRITAEGIKFNEIAFRQERSAKITSNKRIADLDADQQLALAKLAIEDRGLKFSSDYAEVEIDIQKNKNEEILKDMERTLEIEQARMKNLGRSEIDIAYAIRTQKEDIDEKWYNQQYKTMFALGQQKEKDEKESFDSKSFYLKESERIESEYRERVKSGDLSLTMSEIANQKLVTDSMRQAKVLLEKYQFAFPEIGREEHVTMIAKMIDELMAGVTTAGERAEIIQSGILDKIVYYHYLSGQKIARDDVIVIDSMIKNYEDTFVGGWRKGMFEIQTNAMTWGQGMYYIVTTLFSSMGQSFSNYFYDMITGKLKSFKDYAESIFYSVLRAFTDMLGQMAARSIILNAANLLGFVIPGSSTLVATPHTGGIIGSDSFPTKQVSANVFAFAPKAHTGIGPGEVPIIARNNEGVFTPAQMKALAPVSSKPNLKIIINNNVPNTKPRITEQDIKFNGQEWVCTMVLDAVEFNKYGMRSAFGGG